MDERRNPETPLARGQGHEPESDQQGEDEKRGIDPGAGESGRVQGEQVAVRGRLIGF